MTRSINVPRYKFIVSVFLIFMLFSPMAASKHIIVIYDVSGSMVKLNKDYMKSKDIRRVNEYLTDLLFTNTSQSLRDKVNDSYIKECDAVYVGKPLYQSGDTLTYAEYAEKRDAKLNRAQVSKTEFQRQLPNPAVLQISFYGLVSYLLRAEVEVYDELYRDADDETYWVFVTDGDIDNSGKSDPGISSVLKRLAEIEDEFYSPMLYGVFVNNHVKIEVRRLQKRGIIDSIFVATPTQPKKRVQEIQLSPNEEGRFFSETLTIDTENSEKTKFHLNKVDVEIIDRDNKPLQIVNPDNTTGMLIIDPIEFHGALPPHEFYISLPANREIAALDNMMKLEVTYSFKGDDKVFTAPRMNIIAEIKIIYVARPDDPERPVKELQLLFSDDEYSESLTIQTESPKRDAFQIDQIRGHIQYKDSRKLCDAVVPEKIKRIGQPFTVEVPKQDRLDWYGNKVVLQIDYKYKKETLSKTIEIPYKLAGGGTGFPMWLLWLLLVPVLGVILFLLIRNIIGWIKSPIVEHGITLTIEDETSGLVSNSKEPFTLTDKNSLAFGEHNAHELHFDVGWPDCPDYLGCEKYSLWLWSKEKGRIRHYKSIDDTEGTVLELPEILTLTREEDKGEIRVRCEIADETPSPESDDDRVAVGSNSTPPEDPLKI